MDVNKMLKEKYKWLNAEDFWKVHNNWIINHDAVMRIAEEEKIEFEWPELHAANGNSSIAFIGYGMLGKKKMWTTGEASPENCRNPYFFAMAEKRFKDRLTLMLIGVYHLGVYSDTEADAFQQKSAPPPRKREQKQAKKNGYMTLSQEKEIRDLLTNKGVNSDERTQTLGWLADPNGHSKSNAQDAIIKLKDRIKKRGDL